MSTPSVQRIDPIDFIGALLLFMTILLVASLESRAVSGTADQTPTTIATGTIDTVTTPLRTDTKQLPGGSR